jgi:hypothetical protein
MSDQIRVATFEADATALDSLVSQVNASDGAPPGVPAKRITILADRAGGKVLVVVRFGSEEDLRQGSQVLEGMNPEGPGSIRRVAVDAYEVVLEREV